MRFLTAVLLGALAFDSSPVNAQAREIFVPGEGPGPAFVPAPSPGPRGTVLQDQRALLVTHPGAGAGGTDESRLQSAAPLSMTILGFGAQQTAPNRVADDFVIPPGGYTLTGVTVYSYQTGSTTTPTHNGITFQIWNGPPGAMGSSVVFGDTTTNRFSSAAFSNMFRVTDTTSGGTTRPVMAVTASGLNINLAAGTYWLDWSLSGTLASGPWAPPITILGQAVTGNGMQSIAGTWGAALDGGPGSPQQGFPITLEGTPPGTDLVGSLSDTPDPVNAGANLSYAASAINNGPADATDVSMSLPLPAGTTFVSHTPSAGSSCTTPAVGANGTVSCTWTGVTAVTASRTLGVVVAVPASAANGSTLNATLTVASLTNELDPADNAVPAITTVSTSADVSITLADAPDPVTAGLNLTYTATATNNGPSDAQDVAISLPLPANTTLVSAAGTGATCAATTCTFAGATAPGQTRTATYVVTVAASVAQGSSIAANATVSSTTSDPNPANNSAAATTAVIAVADLQIALNQSANQTLINVPVTFTATSTNNGPSDAQNVSVTISLTPDFRYTSHVAAGATCTTPQVGNTGSIVCTWAGATAPGVVRTLTVVAYSNVEGNTAVNASTTSNTTDPVANNNAAGVSVVVGYPFTEIPTLGQYGLMLLGLLVGLIGFAAVRRQG